MSGSVNRAILIGRAGKDPETRTFANGGKVVQFSLATGKKWRDRASGEQKSETVWHNIVVKDTRLADLAAQLVRKGAHLYLEGEISNRTYQKKDGTTGYISEVVLQPFQGVLTLLSDQEAPPRQARQEDAQMPPRPGQSRMEDDGVPF